MYLSGHIRILVLGLSLAACQAVLQGQYEVAMGIGVSDIGFLMEGELAYFGYELSEIEHSIPATAWQVGVGRTFNPEGRLQPSVEFRYARKGINYSTSYLFDDIGYHVRIDYLELPLLLHIRLNMQSRYRPVISLGPYLSCRIRAVRDLTLQGEIDRRTVENVKPFDAGVIGGISRGVIRNPFHLDAGLRISYGLVNMMSPLGGSLARYYGPEKEYARNIIIMITLAAKMPSE